MTPGRGFMPGKGVRAFWRTGNIQFLDLGAGYGEDVQLMKIH